MYGHPPYNENNRSYPSQSNRPINHVVPPNVYYNQSQPQIYYQPLYPPNYPYAQLPFVYQTGIPPNMQFMQHHQMPHPPAGAPIPGSTNHQMGPHSTQHVPMSTSDVTNPGVVAYPPAHTEGVMTPSTNVNQPYNQSQQPRAKKTLQIIDPNTNQEISLNSVSSRNTSSEPPSNNAGVSTDTQSSDSSSSKKHPAKESMFREVHKRALEDSILNEPTENEATETPETIQSLENLDSQPYNHLPVASDVSKTAPICVETTSPHLSDDPNISQPEPSLSEICTDAQKSELTIQDESEYDFRREPHESDASATKRKLMYDREFLLSRAKVKLSLQKPELSETCAEIWQDKPHDGPVYSEDQFDFTPSFANYRHGYAGKGHKNSPNNARRNNRGSMPATPQRVIEAPVRRKEEIKRSKHAYVPKVLNKESKTHNGEPDVDLNLEELKRSIRAILNRVTPQNLDDCMAKLYSLDFGSVDGLSILTNTIFVKAVKEEAYSVTFAEICKRLIFLKSANTQNRPSVSMKSLLLSHCQKKFETKLQDQLDNVAIEWDKKIEVQESEATKKLMMDDKEEQIAKEKDMYYGNIRFIGELFLKDIIPTKVILSCIENLIKNREQEAIESLCKLLETVGSKLDATLQESLRQKFEKYFDEIKKLKDDMDNRLKYKLMDIIEMRSRGWALRKVQEQQKIRPMTKEELEMEGKKKAHELEQEMIEQRAATKKHGASDPRRSVASRTLPPPPQRQPINVARMTLTTQMSADNDMTFRPGKPFGNLAKGCGSKQDKKKQPSSDSDWIPAKSGRSSHGNARQFSRDNSRSRDASPRSSGGPTSLPPPQTSGPSVVRSVSFPNTSSYTKPSSGSASQNSPLPSPSVSTATLPTVEEKAANLKKLRDILPDDCDEFDKVFTKSEHILHEFITADNIDDEVYKRIQNYLPFFVANLLNIMIEKDRSTREKTGLIFAKLISKEKLIPEQFTQGFDLFLENVDDLLIDIPGLWKFIAECLQCLFVDEKSNVGYLTEILLSMREPANVLSDILHMASGRLGHQMVGTIFEQSQLNWRIFLKENQDLDQFLEDKKLQFTLTSNSASGDAINNCRDISDVENGLKELLFTEKLRDSKVENEEIFGILESQVDQSTSQSINYIQMVLGLVFEATIDNKGQINPQLLEDRLPIVKYIVRQKPDEKVQVIYAMQRLSLKLDSSNRNHFLETCLDALTTNLILDSEAITEWEEEEPQIIEGYREAKENLRTYLAMMRTSL